VSARDMKVTQQEMSSQTPVCLTTQTRTHFGMHTIGKTVVRTTHRDAEV